MKRALMEVNAGSPAQQRSKEVSGKNLVVMLIVGIASAALPGYSQSENPGKQEVSVQAFGSFVKSTTNNGIENTATNSGGGVGPASYLFYTPNRRWGE